MLDRWIVALQDGAGQVDDLAAAAEAVALALVTRAAAWLACIPTIVLTSRSIEAIFAVGPRAALVSAVALEVVGQSVTSTWLTAREWNATKRKNDPRANAALALGLTVAYFATDFLLIGVIEVPRALVDPIHWAALLFPLAQVISTVMTGERAAQFRRQLAVDQEARERDARRKERRKVKRQVERQVERQPLQSEVTDGLTDGGREASSLASRNAVFDAQLDSMRNGKRQAKDDRVDSLLTFYEQNPDAGPTEAADAVGVSRTTIYTYQEELEADGRLKKNGNGWEVMA